MSQSNNTKVTRDSIFSILELSSSYLETYKKEKVSKAIDLIDNAEKLIEANNFKDVQVWIYIFKAEFYLTNYNFTSADVYVKKSLKILETEKNERALGKIYEIKGIVDKYIVGSEASKEAYEKSSYYLNRSGLIADRIDINYNLADLYVIDKNWEKVEAYALISIDAIKRSNAKHSRLKYLKIFLLNCYLNKGDLNRAKQIIDELDEFEMKTPSKKFSACFYESKGLYYQKKKDYKLANKFTSLALENRKDEDGLKLRSLGKALAIDYELKQKKEARKRIEAENEFNKAKLKFDKILIVSGIVIIILLLITIYLQYFNRKKERKFNKILKSKNNKLIEANILAEEAVKVKSIFLETINHELRTPLSTVKGIVHLLKDENLTPYQKEQVEILNFSADHLILLINNIIDLSTINYSTINLKFDAFNLKRTLNNLISSVVIKSAENNNNIHRQIDPNIPDEVIGDALKLSQVFINLIGNALKFTNNGDIYIVAKLIRENSKKATIYFEIKDSGIGIKEEFKEVVFESFNQGDENTNKTYGGTGLGLALVKRIIEMHGSKVILKSKEGEGTSFSFLLDFDLVDKVKKTESLDSAYPLELFKTYNLLLVEDNKVNRLITKKIISNYGFNCLVAETGEEAIDIVKSKPVDVVLMDVMLPGIDGFEASRIIKEIKKDITIIGLTAISQTISNEKFEAVGIESVVQKPIKPEELLKHIIENINSNMTASV